MYFQRLKMDIFADFENFEVNNQQLRQIIKNDQIKQNGGNL